MAYHVGLCCCSVVLQVHSFAKSHLFCIRMWPVSLLCLTGLSLTQSKQNYEIQYTNLWCVFLGLWHRLHLSRACHLHASKPRYFFFWIPFLKLFWVAEPEEWDSCVNCRHDASLLAMSEISSLLDAHFCSFFFLVLHFLSQRNENQAV